MNRNYPKPNSMSPEQQNAAREQQIVNARLAALTCLAQVHQGVGTSATRLTEEAEAIIKYVIGDVDALKPKSGLVVTANMPPEGMFKPGE